MDIHDPEFDDFYKKLTAIVFHLCSAQDEQDREVFKLHLECLQELEPDKNILEKIKNCWGDYATLHTKCKEFNLI